MVPNNPPKKGTMHDSLWYLDYYEGPSHLKPPLRMFDQLPNELLIAIAAQTETNHDLCQLSLVNRRLRNIAQSTLMNPVKMPHHGIRKFVEAMIGRLDLVAQIKEVDLGDFGCERHGMQLGECDPELLKLCEDLVTKVAGAEQWTKIVLAKDIGQDDPWGIHSSFYLAILSIIAPDLKILSVEPRPLGNLSPDILVDSPNQILWELQHLSPMFNAPLLQLLQNRLEDLTISTKNSCFKGIHMRNISFTGFTKLKRLSLPMQTLVCQSVDTTNPVAVLPPQLESLEIKSCNGLIHKWISKLFDCVGEDQPSKIRQLDLYFQHCLRSSVVLMCDGNDYYMSGLFLLREMASKYGCNITAYTRSHSSDKHEAHELQPELDALGLLTPPEAWMVATKGEQFSAAVARSDGGAPRARTRLEQKLFLKNTHVPTAFFSSPTFDVAAWEKVLFFKGTRGTKAEFEKKKNKKETGKGTKGGRVGRDSKSSPGHQIKRRGPAKTVEQEVEL
ncbi:hypothetical protein K505DRAFT_64148 [Melanomma pulvis-pyrius CBS 109.77]|uniref:F-box domain-containing protein n=1 Tax=Melanomma pulvis-pyrius CBS 109.77 TaxID=1314802 RepID=A0A6A6X5L3_9PLEO|nr:hypothetical protein K505DRAFT_64148 [Melanomma pulvis-pyrius CBS 109.77]